MPDVCGRILRECRQYSEYGASSLYFGPTFFNFDIQHSGSNKEDLLSLQV